MKLTDMEKCLEEMKSDMDPEYERAKRAQLVEEYEKSLEHKYVVPPHGIEPVNTTCAYPIHIGKVKDQACEEEPEGAEGTSFTFYETIKMSPEKPRSTGWLVHTKACGHAGGETAKILRESPEETSQGL